jgi:glutathione S-transferase
LSTAATGRTCWARSTRPCGCPRWCSTTGAILCYLAEGTPYLPDDRWQRAQVLQWMFFEQYDLEPNIAVVRYWVSVLGTPEQFGDQLEAKLAAGHRVLDALEAHLSLHSFLVGERYTVADIAVYGYTHVSGEGGYELGRYPAVNAWMARIAAQPGHISIEHQG